MVVAADDRHSAAQVRAGQQPEQRGSQVRRRGQRVDDQDGRPLGSDTGQPPQGRAFGQELDRQSRDLIVPLHYGDGAVVGHLPDHGRGEVPFFEDPLHLALTAAANDHQHPLLRLRQHHVVRAHAALATWHA